MLKILQSFGKKTRPVKDDAQRIYQKTMVQSRNECFYETGRVKDSYNGRMEILCFHLSVVLFYLRKFGDNGASLSQSIYDVMIDDFDVALREEGLSDTGVSRRIKPLAKMFFERAHSYAHSLEDHDGHIPNIGEAIEKHIVPVLESAPQNIEFFTSYAEEYAKILENLSFEALSQADFSFPKPN
jgi:cytochrome b pre-mRNA-processing protein 3